MRFWDSSALVALYVEQPAAGVVRRLLGAAPEIASWWSSRVECVSAFCRLGREGELDERSLSTAIQLMHQDAEEWREVQPSTSVRREAERVLRTHPLRAAGAAQLGAALVACEHDPARLPFVCLDDRLAEAARKEGFEVLP